MSDGAQVTTFNPAALADRLKDRIRLELLEAMTPDERATLIRAAAVDFCTDTTPPANFYGSREPQPSRLKVMVREIMTEELRKAARDEVAKWLDGDGAGAVSDVLRDFVRANAADMVRRMFEDSIQRGLTDVLSAMAHKLARD